MTDRVISKDKTAGFLESLMSRFTVVAPMRRGSAPAEFSEIAPGDEPVIDGSVMMMPPKDYLLPRYEALFRVSGGCDNPRVEEELPDDRRRVMLGVWIPDAQAIRVLDRVFLDKGFVDPYYSARRENTSIVAVIPARMRWSWFCGSVDDVEQWKSGVDAVMYDLGARYYVEVMSERGGELFAGDFAAEPSTEDSAAKDRLWEAFESTGRQIFAGEQIWEKLAWDNPIWNEIAEKCVGCGTCSYMCPSCSCFDVQDETRGGRVERYRCRDTCQFEDFTLMSHGHNPRDNQVPRSRQRLLHKFRYQHEQFGVVGCTGCGRCVELCPVNVDIRDVLARVCAGQPETAETT